MDKRILCKRFKKGCLVLIIPGLIFLIWFTFRLIAMMPRISFENTENDTLAVIPLSIHKQKCWVSFRPDESGRLLNCILDIGNNTDCFRVQADDMDYLEELGLLEKSSRWLAPFPTHSGLKKYSRGMELFRTYKVGQIPVNPNNTIKGAYFVEAKENECSLIGINLIINQLVEFSKKDSAMRIHKVIPPDYSHFINMKIDTQKFLHYIRRYDIQMEINGHTYWFFMDTGESTTAVKMPLSDSQYAKGDLEEGVVSLSSGNDTGTRRVKYEKSAFIKVDGKEYRKSIRYTEMTGQETPYVMNPVLFFDEDFLLDFKDLRIWFKE